MKKTRDFGTYFDFSENEKEWQDLKMTGKDYIIVLLALLE